MKRTNSYQPKNSSRIPIIKKNAPILKPSSPAARPRSKSLTNKNNNKKSNKLEQNEAVVNSKKNAPRTPIRKNRPSTGMDITKTTSEPIILPTLVIPMSRSMSMDGSKLKSNYSGLLSPPKPRPEKENSSSFSKALESGTHRLKDLIKASGSGTMTKERQGANDSINQKYLNNSIIDIYKNRHDDYDADCEFDLQLENQISLETNKISQGRLGSKRSKSKSCKIETSDIDKEPASEAISEPIKKKTLPKSALTITKVLDVDSTLQLQSEKVKAAEEEAEFIKAPKPISEAILEKNISKAVKLSKEKEKLNAKISEQELCPKCPTVASKLKKQVGEYKNLKKQKKCLDGILEHKKTLVEELNQQVQTLINENTELSKDVEKASHETERQSKRLHNLSQVKLPKLKVKQAKNQATENAKNTSIKEFPSDSTSNQSHNDKLDKDIKKLLNSCKDLKQKLKSTETEADEIKEFLADILYTLNARGYETITDGKGNTIDLNRCKAKHLLELKGRDARAAKNPIRKTYLQENLLKAIIGSQEKYIQGLIAQIEKNNQDDHYEDLTTREGNPRIVDIDCCRDESFHRDILENEIINTVNLLEAICCRNPDVYFAFKQQDMIETAATGSSNVVLQAVIERCSKFRNSTRRSLNENRSASIEFPRVPTPPPHRARLYSAGQNIIGVNSAIEPKIIDFQKDSLTLLQGKSPKHPYSNPGQLKGFSKPNLTNLQESNQLKRPSSSSIIQLQNQSRSLPSLSNSFHSTYQTKPEQTFSTKKSPHRTPRPSTMHSTSPNQQRRSSGSKTAGSTPCHLCGHRFPVATTMAEVNAHMDMHVTPRK